MTGDWLPPVTSFAFADDVGVSPAVPPSCVAAVASLTFWFVEVVEASIRRFSLDGDNRAEGELCGLEDRDLLRLLLREPSDVDRGGRVPSERLRGQSGTVLAGVASNSLLIFSFGPLAACGLRDGDVCLEVRDGSVARAPKSLVITALLAHDSLG